MFKQLLQLFPLFVLVILTACGGSESTSTVTTFDKNSLLPFSMNNQKLVLTIDTGNLVSNSDDLPNIDSQLIHYFGDGDIVYLQSEYEQDWQYPGSFSYNTQNNDTAIIDIALASSARAYSITCLFNTENSGTWQAQLSGEGEISGSFELTENDKPENFQFLGTIENETSISSSITNVTYPYRVYLPQGYQESTQTYPVIYATDGQWEFWRFAHTIETSNKQIILVAIEQGENDRRIIDYALTGSTNYLAFLANEMLPEIESQYRVDTNNRAIQGASWGGLLVRHALIDHSATPLFKHFISMDGSYFNDNNQYLEMEDSVFLENSHSDINLYLSSATIVGNDNVVKYYKTSLEQREIIGLNLQHKAFNVRHEQVTSPSIKSALLWLYP